MHYYKYFYPKECYIPDTKMSSSLNKEKVDINLIYAFGCTLNVMKPSVVAFTSGSTTFPVDRPLGALYYNENSGNGCLSFQNRPKINELILRRRANSCIGIWTLIFGHIHQSRAQRKIQRDNL